MFSNQSKPKEILMQVIKDTYEWLTVAYGDKKFSKDERSQMIDTVKGLMLEEFKELQESYESNNKKEQLNAIADLMFVTLNAPFFKGTPDWEVEFDLSDWVWLHTHKSYIRKGKGVYYIVYFEDEVQTQLFTFKKYISNYFVKTNLTDYFPLVLLDLESIGLGLGFTKEQIEEECRKTFLSNMTKFCRTEEDAIRTVKAYKNGTHPNKLGVSIDATYKPTGHPEFKYRIERVSDKKLLKADTFQDVDQF